jgi:hypothetical protein
MLNPRPERLASALLLAGLAAVGGLQLYGFIIMR